MNYSDNHTREGRLFYIAQIFKTLENLEKNLKGGKRTREIEKNIANV